MSELTPEQEEHLRWLQGQRLLYGLSLNRLGKNVYGGTVTPAEKARRRARGKVAKQSRKANR